MRQPLSSRLFAVVNSPYFVPLCFAVYIGLRLAVIIGVPIEQHSDEQWYFNRAVAIAAGQGYSEDNIPTAYWPVGWPGFLGLVFYVFHPSPFIGQMVNLLCSAATFLLTLRLGTLLFAEELVGRLSVLLLTICPNQIAYVPTLGTETFYIPLLLLAIYFLVAGNGWWRAAASGISFGIATLTKAQTLLLPAALFAVWWVLPWRQRRAFSGLGTAVVVYVAMAAVILPWTARNYRVFGAIIPISTNGGMALLVGNNPSAQGDSTPNDALVERVLALPHDPAHQLAADHLAGALALDWIRDHPGRFILLIPEKIWRLWAPDGEAEWSYQIGYDQYDKYWVLFRAVRIINQAYYLGLMLLFIGSIWICYRDRQLPSAEFSTGYALVLVTTAISVVFYGQSRYHFVFIPWIAMYASWSIIRLSQPRIVVRRVAA